MNDPLRSELDRAADRIRAARIIAKALIDGRKAQMPPRLIEIKGLGDALSRIRKGIKDIREMTASVNESTSGLVAELTDVKQQIEDARSDLKFEAQTLGNSNSQSSDG